MNILVSEFETGNVYFQCLLKANLRAEMTLLQYRYQQFTERPNINLTLFPPSFTQPTSTHQEALLAGWLDMARQVSNFYVCQKGSIQELVRVNKKQTSMFTI